MSSVGMLLGCVVEQKECVISSTQLLVKVDEKKNEISTGYISRRKIENNKKKKRFSFRWQNREQKSDFLEAKIKIIKEELCVKK